MNNNMNNMNMLLKAFKMNITSHKQEIKTAQKAYLIAAVAEETIKEISEDIQKKILSENVYLQNRRGVTERITDPKHTFLMNDEIFINDFLEKCYIEYQKAGIADIRGKEYFPEAEARDARINAENALIQIAVDILPECDEKEVLKSVVNHWKYRDEILQLILYLDCDVI